MTAVVHGGVDYAELHALGIRPERLLDFSSNINPFGPPPGVRRALAALDPAPYPDRACTALRAALSARYGCAPEMLLIGNGSVDLIYLIARALLRPGDVAIVVAPTFGEYAHASHLSGAAVVSVSATDTQAFALDRAALLDAVAVHRPRLVWLCSPNNPTGVTVARADLCALAEACGAIGGYLVLDAAYTEMERGVTPAEDIHAWGEQVLVLRSLTKAYALAGLRLGCLVACPELARRIAVYQPAWSVNSAAQAAGLAAIGDRDFLSETLPLLWRSSDMLRAGLEGLGLSVLPSPLPFFLVRVGDGARVRAALLQHGCLVRDCASFGLPAYVRVAPRHPEQNLQLIDVWSELCRRL